MTILYGMRGLFYRYLHSVVTRTSRVMSVDNSGQFVDDLQLLSNGCDKTGLYVFYS